MVGTFSAIQQRNTALINPRNFQSYYYGLYMRLMFNERYPIKAKLNKDKISNYISVYVIDDVSIKGEYSKMALDYEVYDLLVGITSNHVTLKIHQYALQCQVIQKLFEKYNNKLRINVFIKEKDVFYQTSIINDVYVEYYVYKI